MDKKGGPVKSGGKTKIRKKEKSASADDLEVIEVSGEAITREEAEKLKIDPSLYMDSGTLLLSDESASAELPPGSEDSLEAKIKTARKYLHKKEVEKALTLAQEAVWAQPDFIPAKIIIARCFTLRKQFDKGLAILNAIKEEDRNAEIFYHMAVCQSNMGHITEALELLKTAKAANPEPPLRKKIAELASHLKGGHVICPGCGKKIPTDEMQEVDGRMLCPDCAEDADGDQDDDDDDDELADSTRGHVRKKRRRHSKATFILIILIVLFFGLVALKSFDPKGFYADLAGIFRVIPYVGDYFTIAFDAIPDLNAIVDGINAVIKPLLNLVGL